MKLGLLILGLLVLQDPSVRERMVRGLELLRAGERERAERLFESVVADVPDHGPARLQLGELALESGDFETARSHLEVAVRAEPHRPHLAWHLLARARRAVGDVRGARAALDEALAIAPDFVPAHVDRAEEAEARGDRYTALEHSRRAAALAPDRADLHAALASTAWRTGALELARCAAAKAWELDAENPALLFLRAVIEESSGNVAESLLWAERARDGGMEEAALFLTLGNLYHEQMRLDDAMDAFETALGIDPDVAENLASFALSSLATEDHGRLRRLLEAHAETHPDSRNTLYSLGTVYLRENELERALAVFERLGRLEPDASQVAYNLHLIHARAGRVEEARTAMARFRELRAREDREWERQNDLARMRREIGEALARGAPRRALDLGERLPEEDRNLEDRLALAGAHAALSEWPSAARLLDRALEADPYHRGALSARLRVARELGESTGELERRSRLLAPHCETVP